MGGGRRQGGQIRVAPARAARVLWPEMGPVRPAGRLWAGPVRPAAGASRAAEPATGPRPGARGGGDGDGVGVGVGVGVHYRASR